MLRPDFFPSSVTRQLGKSIFKALPNLCLSETTVPKFSHQVD